MFVDLGGFGKYFKLEVQGATILNNEVSYHPKGSPTIFEMLARILTKYSIFNELSQVL